MLDQDTLKELAVKFQTDEKNVVREYVQHLFLSNLYKIKTALKLYFKGGTALRVIYQSPRFSEDIDFTGQNIFRSGEIDDLFLETLERMERSGLKISYKEAQPTQGGYLGIISYDAIGFREDMKFEVSLRQQKKQAGEVTSIVSDFIPPYTLQQLSTEILVREKLQALLFRKKPRDYYDLYFILRHPALRSHLPKKDLKDVRVNLEQETVHFKRELSVLLPASHHLVLRNFREMLKREVSKYL